MKIKISYSGIAIVLFYGFDLLYLCLMHVMPTNNIAKTVSTIILYFILLLAVSKSKRIIKIDAVMCMIAIFSIFMLSYLCNPEYGYAMFDLPMWNIWTSVFTLTSGIFGYLFFRIEERSEVVKRLLKYMGFILFCWGCIRAISSIQSGGFTRISSNGNILTDSYDMSVGYRFLFAAIVFTIFFLEAKKLKKLLYLLLTVLSIVFMLIFGSRTAVVSYLLFIILRMLFYNDGKSLNRRIAWRVAIILLLGIGYLALTNKSVLLALAEILSKAGFNSRMLNTLVAGSVSLDNGRNRLWTSAIELIKEHPILGCGVYADRYFGGIYCHQIILEILLDFGVIIGTVIIVLLIKGIIEMLFKCEDKNWKLLFIVFLSMSIIRLNVSSSFWCDTNFWICIAIYVNYRRTRYLVKE